MSKSLRTEQDRRIDELQALVVGLSAEVTRWANSFDDCRRTLDEMHLILKRLEARPN